MKLHYKISLVCGAVLAAVILLCTAVQLHTTSQNLLVMAAERACEKQRVLADSFVEMVNYFGSEDDSPAVRRSLMSYCFKRFADGRGVLIADGEVLCGDVGFSPADYLPLSSREGQKHSAAIIGGKQYNIVGSSVDLAQSAAPLCLVFVAEDISAVYAQIAELRARFLCIGISGLLLGLTLVVLLVHRALAPLGALRETAADIAGGDYGRRADINSRDEVGELARSFNSMAEAVQSRINELTETAERQRLFIGAVSHEFKTPLTGILLNADNLQNAYMSETEQEAALSAIHGQAAWLEALVQKMLKLITVRQDISVDVFPVSLLLERVRECTRGILAGRGIKLEIRQADFDITGDIDFLQSALVNLVDNAAKASADGDEITITAQGGTITVKDFAGGIPPESLARITEPFYTPDKSRSKRQGGAGLGLALVREIAAAHGAALEIESAPGAGTSVSIHFEQ